MTMTGKSSAEGRRRGRRRFLREMALAGAGLLAAGCAANEIAQPPAAYRTATPFRAIASPQAGPGVVETAAAEEGSISLEEFLQFSSLLTGVEDLDPAIGQVYLNALQSAEGEGPGLAEVYAAASSAGDLEALQGAGFFDQEEMRGTADQIILMWYTGIYTDGEEERVATFVDALAWKVLHFTKPPTICGEFGFWSQAPRVDLSPQIQYTPVPSEDEEEE